MKRILHIAVHVGGGIGSAYAGLTAGTEDQRILLLEKPLDEVTLSRVREAGFKIILDADRNRLCEEIELADMVVINWTHHPALVKLLADFPKIPIRSILWCHVSGNYYPVIPVEFVKLFDQVMFATPYSLNLPQFRALGEDYIKEHFHVVYGLNDLARFGNIDLNRHDYFQIGYIGTLGFCKLNPDFADYCSAINIPDVKFVMAGAANNDEQIINRYHHNGGENEICFLGQVKDVTNVLENLDVFGYLLNPQHFGATENALLEAMAAGLPVVAINQCVEKYIIKDQETGLLVNTKDEYRQAIQYFYDNPKLAGEMGKRAREHTLNQYDIEKNRQRFIHVCMRAEKADKTVHKFEDFFCGSPSDWFLSCVGQKERKCFERNHLNGIGNIFYESTKGSPLHFHNYFINDERLADWANIINEKKKV